MASGGLGCGRFPPMTLRMAKVAKMAKRKTWPPSTPLANFPSLKMAKTPEDGQNPLKVVKRKPWPPSVSWPSSGQHWVVVVLEDALPALESRHVCWREIEPLTFAALRLETLVPIRFHANRI